VLGEESWNRRSCSRRPATACALSRRRWPSSPGCGIATEPPGMAGGAGRTAPTAGPAGLPSGARGGVHAGAGRTTPKRGGVCQVGRRTWKAGAPALAGSPGCHGLPSRVGLRRAPPRRGSARGRASCRALGPRGASVPGGRW